MDNTKEIERDFIAKRDTYFTTNYVNKTKSNYLRRYRNELIRGEIEKLKKVSVVLDAGCGPAILYPELLERCEEYHALDLVESNLQQIRSHHDSDSIKTIQSDLDSVNLEKQQYDLVISSGSIEYASNYEYIIKALMNSLKPNGTLIISFPNKRSPYRIWSKFGYRYIKNLRNYLRGIKAPKYNRELFSERFVRKQLGATKTDANLAVEYIGVKLIPQPFDYLMEGIDFSVLRYFHKHPSKYLSKFAQEFLIIYQK